MNILIPWILSMLLGIFVGGAPGLTATMAVALIVPLTYHMTPAAGLAMIIGVSFCAIFAGDIPATYLRIPGTPASGAAVLDGYEMARKGKGPLALALDLSGSVLGGLIGITILIFVAPILAKFALKFTNFEYFWLALFGLSMSAVISRGTKIKGVISMTLGLIFAAVGIDITTGYPRFTFGSIELMGGIGFIPAMIGLFGLSEAFKSAMSPENFKTPTITEKIQISFASVGHILYKYKLLIIRSSIIGNVIGALPGAGADIAAWVSYGMAKKMSNRSEEYGTGIEEGIIAPTSANNAALGGTWIPALVFGIPGDTITAIVLGAMMMYGLKPGPLIFQQNAFLVNQIFSVAIVSQFFLLMIGWFSIRIYTYLFKFPRNIVLVGVLIFSVVGSYALRSSLFDVGIMLVFGILGYVMERCSIPLPPLILGLILGPMIEDNLRVGLVKSDGSFLPFLTRPISMTLAILLIIIFFWEYILRFFKFVIGKRKD
ncbi:MAG: tripartite tricarboxylate transporter permease [Proteobacteria bacterium]|nr:tripartite tricarboxylate transporter permease [Pseudomonadota bacterium]